MSQPSEDRYLIVSTDGHAGLLPEKYRDYVDPQHRDVFDVRVAEEIARPIQPSEVLPRLAGV